MNMRVSDAGVAEIAAHEGIVPYPYKDSVGVWTLGIGHTASAGSPDPAKLPKGVEVPMHEVLAIFRRDLRKFEDRVNSAVKVPLKQHEFDALVSFDFNTGGIHKANLTKLLNAGDRKGAATAFMGWSKPKEIIPRREKEQALFRDGKYISGGMATVYRANANGTVLWSTGKRVDVLALMRGKPAEPQKPSGPPPGTTATPPGLASAIAALFRAIARIFTR